MKITISTASPDLLARETLILGFFSDERPPKGYCGLVDWRLNGRISAEIASGRISGNFLEKVACSFPGRLAVSRFLLFGMGALTELTYDRLYNGGFEIGRTMSGIGATDLALPVPAAGRGPLKLPGMTEALLTGFFDGGTAEAESRAALGVEVPVQDDQVFEILQGLELFRKRAGSAQIEILEIETQPTDRAEAPGGGRPDGKLLAGPQ
ncbi:MAG: hypothetical protein ACYC7J_09755 [Syntrophales bacterium]